MKQGVTFTEGNAEEGGLVRIHVHIGSKFDKSIRQNEYSVNGGATLFTLPKYRGHFVVQDIVSVDPSLFHWTATENIRCVHLLIPKTS